MLARFILYCYAYSITYLLSFSTTPRGHYTEPDARGITLQVLQAVKYLHEQDVIHRDIKPENILVSTGLEIVGNEACSALPGENKPVVKLSDFGLAKFIGDGAQMAMTTCGTPTYSAPEIWKGAYTNKVRIITFMHSRPFIARFKVELGSQSS